MINHNLDVALQTSRLLRKLLQRDSSVKGINVWKKTPNDRLIDHIKKKRPRGSRDHAVDIYTSKTVGEDSDR